ncbi:hypothetical protein GCM10023196_087030 [Actinoallomurus vinaceus]|uniref:GerMN domain-containing protein n=1 Tax=Actinoallomurus vinaceus TaxID=1080074 RepID=A0ABP8URY2_9ACTN
MRRVLRAIGPAAAVCALVGCGVRPTGVVNAGEAPTATATSLPRAQVYFLLDDGRPRPVTRAVAPWDTQAVFDALLAGPTDQESAHGLHTELTPDVTIRVVGSRAVFVEYANAFSKQSMAGYTQIYCTALLLPGAPIVRMPGALDQKLQAEQEQKLRAGMDMCPGAAVRPGADGVPSSPNETSPGPEGAFPGATPMPGESVPATRPPVVSGKEKVPSRKPGPLLKPSRSG